MKVGDPCPFCGEALVMQRAPGPRQGGRAIFAYCKTDRVAWENAADKAQREDRRVVRAL